MQKTAAYQLFLSPVIRYTQRMSKDPRPDPLSAEYALGLLRGSERTAADDELDASESERRDGSNPYPSRQALHFVGCGSCTATWPEYRRMHRRREPFLQN